ncbi:MAG TPA: glycosyltransferase [Candidatus Babeliaceae bacterium]|nr:glycosyltransferase [Candidatus Babeliaceae bacterium]
MKQIKKGWHILQENWLSLLLLWLSIINFCSPYLLKCISNKIPILPDFDISMSNHVTPGKKTSNLYTPELILTAKILRNLYNRNQNLLSQPTKAKIPKIIHQIWLGSPFPGKYRRYQASWIRFHPDWQYKLWTDKDIKKLKLHNQKAYDAAPNYGEKADIARLQILYEYGGLYVDVDFECVQPFDLMNDSFELYVGISRPETMRVNNALIGVIPAHPFIKQCIDGITPNIGTLGSALGTIERTGPAHFTRCFMKYLGLNSDNVIAFPSSFFYPIPHEIGKFYFLEQVKPWIRPETFAIHYWASSWN